MDPSICDLSLKSSQYFDICSHKIFPKYSLMRDFPVRAAHSLFLFCFFREKRKGYQREMPAERPQGTNSQRSVSCLYSLPYVTLSPEKLIMRPVQLLLQYFKSNYHFSCLKFELYYMRLKRATFAH